MERLLDIRYDGHSHSRRLIEILPVLQDIFRDLILVCVLLRVVEIYVYLHLCLALSACRTS